MKLQISDPYGKNCESKLCRWKCYILNFLLPHVHCHVPMFLTVIGALTNLSNDDDNDDDDGDGRWWVGCHISYKEEGSERGRSPPRPLLALPNVTAHPSTASVPITVLLYNGTLLCGFNVSLKGHSGTDWPIFFSFNKKFNISHFHLQSLDSQFLL